MHASVFESIFWGSVLALAYVYAGYPFFLIVAGALKKRAVRKDDGHQPTVSILISAFDEERCIASTIRNKLDLDYPAEKIEILVTSDGSTDGTDERVRAFAANGVRLIRQSPRRGKTAALNRMAAEAKGEILVFSDANSIYAKDALRRLVRNFADPEVGYVTGKMIYVDETGSAVGSGCTAYMRYENALRSLETRTGSIIGVDGGIDAVRASLYVPMREDLLPDFVLPMEVLRRGRRVVYESGALLKEPALATSSDEWKMRVRVILRFFHALSAARAALNPFRHPQACFRILSHKVLRYLAGVFQISAFAANAVLAAGPGPYRALLAAQGAFYLLFILGATEHGARRVPGARFAYYFCLLNAAALAALGRFARGERQVVWTPRVG